MTLSNNLNVYKFKLVRNPEISFTVLPQPVPRFRPGFARGSHRTASKFDLLWFMLRQCYLAIQWQRGSGRSGGRGCITTVIAPAKSSTSRSSAKE